MAGVASTTSEVGARGRGGGAAGAGLSPERDGSWAFQWSLRGQSAFGYFGCRFRGCRARGPGRIGAAAIGAWPRTGIVVVDRCRRGVVRSAEHKSEIKSLKRKTSADLCLKKKKHK